MSASDNFQRLPKQQKLISIGLSVFIISLVLNFARAQNFDTPNLPAPHNPDGFNTNAFNKFVLKAQTSQQDLQGTIDIALTQESGAVFSPTIDAYGNRISVMTSAGDIDGPDQTPFYGQAVGIYAYAQGSGSHATAYGSRAKVSDANAVAVAGKVNTSAAIAGLFRGPLTINNSQGDGTLEVDNQFIALGQVDAVSSGRDAPALLSNNSSHFTGYVPSGFYGFSETASGLTGITQSDNRAGVHVIKEDIAPFIGDTMSVIFGDAGSGPDGIPDSGIDKRAVGVRGWSNATRGGDGIWVDNPANSTAPMVYGYSNRYTGIFAKGTPWAAILGGNFELDTSLDPINTKLYIFENFTSPDGVIFTEEHLRYLWCYAHQYGYYDPSNSWCSGTQQKQDTW